MSLTPAFGQTGRPTPDTVRCYGLTELRYIAATLVEARACDTLLSNANAKVSNRDSMIVELNLDVKRLENIILLKDKIIESKEQEKKKLQEDLETEVRRHKWTKLGWTSSSVALGGFIVYLLLR